MDVMNKVLELVQAYSDLVEELVSAPYYLEDAEAIDDMRSRVETLEDSLGIVWTHEGPKWRLGVWVLAHLLS